MTLPARIALTLGLALIVELVGQAIFRSALANVLVPFPIAHVSGRWLLSIIPDAAVLAMAAVAYWLVLRYGIGDIHETKIDLSELAARGALVSPGLTILLSGLMAWWSLPSGSLLSPSALADPAFVMRGMEGAVRARATSAFHGILAAIGLTLIFCYAVMRGKTIPPARAAATTIGSVFVSIIFTSVSI